MFVMAMGYPFGLPLFPAGSLRFRCSFPSTVCLPLLDFAASMSSVSMSARSYMFLAFSPLKPFQYPPSVNFFPSLWRIVFRTSDFFEWPTSLGLPFYGSPLTRRRLFPSVFPRHQNHAGSHLDGFLLLSGLVLFPPLVPFLF